jgi:hypothetical protein
VPSARANDTRDDENVDLRPRSSLRSSLCLGMHPERVPFHKLLCSKRDDATTSNIVQQLNRASSETGKQHPEKLTP